MSAELDADRTLSREQPQAGADVMFEMAYQIRVAIDKIRFALRWTEQSSHDPAVVHEARMQLLDALERLESAERQFSNACRKGAPRERAR